MRRFGPPPPDGGPRLHRADPTGPRSGRPTLPGPPTEILPTPSGVRLEQLITGVGEPVTVFAHGLGGDISGTRPLGSAVTGRRVFFHFRGHGRSDAPVGPWSFADLADDLRGVADLTGATRALGVSMGAGALSRLIGDTPDRFERVVFYLPAPLDGTRPAAAEARVERLLAAVESGEAASIAAAVEAELPPSVRNTPAGWSHLRQRVEQLQRDGLASELTTLWHEPAVPDESLLRAFRGRALVLGCLGDEVHPAAWAERLAGLLPGADLHVYDRPAVLWNNRAELRTRISEFLNS
ncbi:esterase [Paractinoplanes abujensis]|uniref:Pimeloyl-ACP methyl ester carboxylesterase n=1 Tax=Paractinoplanes abujensis TaxID=882441 RepID=A0A7W7CXP4_9ACTN|nr:alpha/beta hydrolase [Actinoplanes abujensis]MBB4696542.1 pimeloyl-ACP methyl ester carboxylesterase [Actinoplanes abujensis]GID18993.1 esterase [Actinoplanes abujensis]